MIKITVNMLFLNMSVSFTYSPLLLHILHFVYKLIPPSYLLPSIHSYLFGFYDISVVEKLE